MTLSSADQQARSRFQSGLLAWLRAADDASGLREMVAVVRGRAIDDAPNALLWRSAEAFLQAILDSAFSVVSVMTTTGFATADFDTWPVLSKVLLVGLMFVGGCAGSERPNAWAAPSWSPPPRR